MLVFYIHLYSMCPSHSAKLRIKRIKAKLLDLHDFLCDAGYLSAGWLLRGYLIYYANIWKMRKTSILLHIQSSSPNLCRLLSTLISIIFYFAGFQSPRPPTGSLQVLLGRLVQHDGAAWQVPGGWDDHGPGKMLWPLVINKGLDFPLKIIRAIVEPTIPLNTTIRYHWVNVVINSYIPTCNFIRIGTVCVLTKWYFFPLVNLDLGQIPGGLLGDCCQSSWWWQILVSCQAQMPCPPAKYYSFGVFSAILIWNIWPLYAEAFQELAFQQGLHSV